MTHDQARPQEQPQPMPGEKVHTKSVNGKSSSKKRPTNEQEAHVEMEGSIVGFPCRPGGCRPSQQEQVRWETALTAIATVTVTATATVYHGQR